jgi:hypothetical protein
MPPEAGVSDRVSAPVDKGREGVGPPYLGRTFTYLTECARKRTTPAFAGATGNMLILREPLRVGLPALRLSCGECENSPLA